MCFLLSNPSFLAINRFDLVTFRVYKNIKHLSSFLEQLFSSFIRRGLLWNLYVSKALKLFIGT